MGQPLPAIANTFRIRLMGTVNASNWASVQYAAFTGPPPSANDCLTVATAVANAWRNAIAPVSATTTHLTGVEIIDLTSEVASTGTHEELVQGTRAGPSLPNSMAAVASYKINRRYRGGHPRTYWPTGVDGDVSNGNLFNASFKPLMDNAATAWVGDINLISYGGGTLQHGCVSYYERDPSRPGHSMLRAQPIFFKTQSVVVHGRWDTQRRRLGKELA